MYHVYLYELKVYYFSNYKIITSTIDYRINTSRYISFKLNFLITSYFEIKLEYE